MRFIMETRVNCLNFQLNADLEIQNFGEETRMDDQDPTNQIKQALLTVDIELRNLPDYSEVVDSAIAAARSAINAASAVFKEVVV